jgi:hypothetical protein
MEANLSRTNHTSSAPQFLAEIQTLLDEQKYDQARARAAQRLGIKPGDRAARLALLLVNVMAFGAERYGPEIKDLRSLAGLGDQEREFVRRLFLIAFNSAQKVGDQKQALLYQRCLRRLLLGQPLDDPESNVVPLPSFPERRIASEKHREAVLEAPRPDRFAPFHSIVAAIPLWRPKKVDLILLIGAAVLAVAVFLVVARSGREDGIPNPDRRSLEIDGTVPSDVSLKEKPVASGKEYIKELADDYASGLEQTYRKWRRNQPNLSAWITLKVATDRAGTVVNVQDLDVNAPDRAFRTAVMEQVRKWKFSNRPAPEQFTLRFVFGSSGDSRDPDAIRISGVRTADAVPSNIRSVPGGGHNEPSRTGSSTFAVFLFSVLLWAASLFSVGEAVRVHSSYASVRDRSPQSPGMVDMAQLLSCLFVLGWFGRNLFLSPASESPLDHLGNLLLEPEHLIPGVLLGVFPPVLIGGVKLIAGIGVKQSDDVDEIERRNWLWVNLTYLSVLLVLGITAALLLFFKL